jgi:[ribosomal protein S18]-alanine N-acetyltransferase
MLTNRQHNGTSVNRPYEIYKIRSMRRDDLQQVTEIDKEAFPTQWPPTNYRSELQNHLAHYLVVYEESGTSFELQKTFPDDGSFYSRLKRLFRGEKVIEQAPGDLIVGFVGGWIMADELHITEIATRGTHRGRGIGHLMLISIIGLGYELKARLTTLEVRVSNVSAQKLYEKFGFQKVGFRKAYYSDNKEDAIIMTTPDISLPEYQLRLSYLKTETAEKWGLDTIPVLEKPQS